MQGIEKSKFHEKQPATESGHGRLGASCRRLDSRELFTAGNELLIDHHGASYRLQITRQGKLILTK
ncbi:MAG: hemin uptake protein HemP [Rhodocyclales bacterium]|nr:hemin uptake protein HemP [Rhodocyclales bacterium]